MSIAINKTDNILIIVESPNKCSTISSILKKAGYSNVTVKASVGHIMILADGGTCFNSGIYPSKNFEMNLKVSPDKGKIVNELKTSISKADKIILMTDPDREGALISWSLIKFLNIPVAKYFRAVTHEITPQAVIKAIENPIPLETDLVEAGLTRLCIDKLIGYGLSPAARKFIGAKSVGRCQSIGLALIADREKEIEEFVPETFYDLILNFEKENTKFSAKYIGTKLSPGKNFTNKIDLDFIIKDCSNSVFKIQEKNIKTRQESPKPPFCTATFQQEASIKLGLKVKDAMNCAQKLFEGIEIKGDHIALISYHRTDSTEFAPEFIPTLKNFIEKTYGQEKFTTPRVGKKQASDQVAHECLRVIDPNLTPEELTKYISNNLLIKVYTLIWNRTIMAAMPNAKYSDSNYIISNKDYLFSFTQSELIDSGFKCVSGQSDSEKTSLNKITFSQNEVLKNTNLETITRITQPKSRYTEASLIKELQTREIGRPSTYATIVETILSTTRNYAKLEDKYIVPTNLGIQLANFCKRSFSNIINYNYTKKMEEGLDQIASGKLSRLAYLTEFYNDLTTAIKNNKETHPLEETDQVCPICGAKMVARRSKFGKLFYGCSTYPKCRGIVNI